MTSTECLLVREIHGITSKVIATNPVPLDLPGWKTVVDHCTGWRGWNVACLHMVAPKCLKGKE